MKNKQNPSTKQFQRYGIRKFSQGVASVMIASGMFFLGSGAVSADEVVANTPNTDSTTQSTDTKNQTDKKEDTTATATTAEASKLDTKALSAAIEKIQKAFDDKTYDATTVAGKALSEKLEAATRTLKDTQATQLELDNTVKSLEEAVKVVEEEINAKIASEAVEKVAEVDKEAVTTEATATTIVDKTTLNNLITEAPLVTAEVDKYAASLTDEATKKTLTDTVAAVNTQVKAANAVVKNDKATAEEVTAAENNLRNAVKAASDALVAAGHRAEFAVNLDDTAGVLTTSHAVDYIIKPDGTKVATETDVTTATGKDIYTFTANGKSVGKAGEVTTDRVNAGTGDFSSLEIVIGSNQRTGTETNPSNSGSTEDGGKRGKNNFGRVDYPLTDEASRKLAAETPLWNGKLRIDGSTISTAPVNEYKGLGAYEYLATHIYHLVYEQGSDQVYIPNISKRFNVSEAAAKAGWTLTSVEPTNLPPGLYYDAQNDTIVGHVVSNLSNGVYDMRTYVTVTNTNTGATLRANFQNLRAGWIGWQDTTPPKIESNGKTYKGTVGDTMPEVDILYKDDSGSRMFQGGSNVSYTLSDGRVVTVRNEYTNKNSTGISGNVVNGTGTIDTIIPGLTYTANGKSAPVRDGNNTIGYDSNGVISGTPTTAGVYYTTVYGKDYNSADRATGTNNSWYFEGREARGGLTFTIAPKVEALNVSTYATSIPVTVSQGATYAEIIMPDGTKTIVENHDGHWVVATGTTNTAVTVGQDLGVVGSQFDLPVTHDNTAIAGSGNITVYAKSENVLASLMRSKVQIKGADGTEYVATLNNATGQYEIPADKAEVRVDNVDGTYHITKREVRLRVQADGSMIYDLYEYDRTYNAAGDVTAVNPVTLTPTTYAKEDTANTPTGNGMNITVTYDKVKDTWTASDGSTVTATKTGDNSWTIETTSGYTGTVNGTVAENTTTASIINTKPTSSSTDYESYLGNTVDLVKASLANFKYSDTEDDALRATDPTTTHISKITKVTVVAPSGVTKTFDTVADVQNYVDTPYTLNELGTYTITIDVEDSNNENGGKAVGAPSDINTTNAVTSNGDSTTSTTYHIVVKTGTPTATPATSTDIVGASQSGTVSFTAGKTTVNGKEVEVPLPTNKAFVLVDANGAAQTTVPAYAKTTDGSQGEQVGTYTINADTGEVTYTPFTPTTATKLDTTYVGEVAPATVALTNKDNNNVFVVDADGKTVTTTYTPTIIPVTPVADKSETTGAQGATQTSTITYNADGNTDQNTTTLNFSKGSAEVNGTTKSVELDKTTVQFVNDEGTAVDTLTVENQGTYTLVKDSEGNVTGVQFVPVATFTGDATPVKVQIKDVNGTAVQTTYTPHVTPVTATGTPATSTDIQGATQTGTATFTVSDDTNIVKGDDNKPKATYSLEGANAAGEVTVENEGTYTINATTGEVTFKPVATFTGEATGVTVKATYTLATADEADTTTADITATAKYTPTVVPVKPTADSSETTGVQGATQTSTISYDAAGNNDGDKTTLNFAKGSAAVNNETKSVELDKKSVQFVNDEGTAVDTLTVANQGTYTLVKDGDGNVTGVQFTPVATFTGDATPVTVQIKDKNGTVAKTTYTPHVTPAEAKAEPATSTATQGSTQSGTPTYTAPKVGDGVTVTPKYELEGANADGKVVVEGVGTYSIDENGKVTFVPVASYTGTPTPAKVKVTYTITTGVEGETPATITAETTYTPTVTPVTAEGTPKESTDIQGAVQNGTPTFTVSDETNIVKGEDGKPAAIYALKGADADGKVEVKDGDKVLYTYTINATTGEVTFTPAKDYTGTPSPVTVVATYTLATADEADTTTTPIVAEATYTPTIVPAAPTASKSSTTGIQGATQTSEVVLDGSDKNVNTVNFNKGTTTVNGEDKSVDLDPSTLTLLDASGKPATSVTVEGQGTYTIIEKDGKKYIQFTPVASYTGDVTPVTVQIADANGTKVTTTYTPKIVGVSPVADASETTGNQGQKQTSPIVYDADNNSDGKSTTLNFAGGSATINGTKQTAALDKKSVTLLDANGNAVDTVTVENEGTYTLVKDDEGNVTAVDFQPTADFTGTATPVKVRVTDVNGNTDQTTYTPTVIANGTVKVNYVDTKGNTIKDTVTKSALENGSAYDVTTTDYKPATIEKDSTVYYYRQVKDGSAAQTGKVVGGETAEVTYVYEEAGSVTVNYVDKDGNEIKSPVKDVDNGKPGDKYDTTDKKETTITTEDGKTYKLVPTETKGNETGTITSGENTQVTYVYEEVKGNVEVENYDTKGNKLGDTVSVKTDVSTGTKYETTPEDKLEVNGKTYYYKEVKSDSAATSGKVTEGTTTVKYVYEEAGYVTVNYVDKDGNEIKSPVKDVDNGKPGDKYDTTDKKETTITTEDGKTYKLVPSLTKGNETGTITSGENTQVTYVYEEVKGNVEVENYDTKGNKLGDTVSVKTDVSTGTKYETTPEDKLEVNGKTYYYKEVKSDSAATSGKVTEGTTTVKYVYEEAGSVTVNYVDKDGNEIKSPVKDVDNGKPGDKYDTTDKKETTITTEDGKTYRLVPSLTKGNETGTITSGENTQVTYVYEEVKTSYVDKNGKEIPGYPTEDGEQPKKDIPGYRYVETKKLPNGDTEHVYEKVTTSYITEDGKKIPGYPTEDGEQSKKDIPGYEFVRTEVDSNGNITHVYKPVTMPTTPTQLPNTGVAGSTGVLGAAAAAIMAGLGIALPKKKKDDNE